MSSHYNFIKKYLVENHVQLVAVSKMRTDEQVMKVYDMGQRIFGENKVQELVAKHQRLPQDIVWHMIGHLQTNKVAQIASFISLIHSVDSLKLLVEINKQAQKCNRIIPVLLQIFIAKEETKYGLLVEEMYQILEYYTHEKNAFQHIEIKGLMGMASNTPNTAQIAEEFATLRSLYLHVKESFFPLKSTFDTLSMGMSGDYKIAIANGSNMVRIGSLLFED